MIHPRSDDGACPGLPAVHRLGLALRDQVRRLSLHGRNRASDEPLALHIQNPGQRVRLLTKAGYDVAKRRDSAYLPGVRSDGWRKDQAAGWQAGTSLVWLARLSARSAGCHLISAELPSLVVTASPCGES